MSRKVGAIARPQTDETYYAQYAGFQRDAAGKIRSFKGTKTKTNKETNETYTVAFTRVYPQYRIVTGKYAGVEFSRAIYIKGFKLISGDDGGVMFDYPGEFKPYFINDMRANGVDFAVDLLERPLFDMPVNQESVLEGVDALQLEKAREGNFVAVKLAELGDGTLVISTALDGISKVSQEVAEMLRGKIQAIPAPPTPATSPPSGPTAAVQAERQRLAEYVRYLMGVAKEAEKVDVGILQFAVRATVKGWGIKLRANVPILSLLDAGQLREVIKEVSAVLDSEKVEYAGLAPLEPEPAEEFIDAEDIQF